MTEAYDPDDHLSLAGKLGRLARRIAAIVEGSSPPPDEPEKAAIGACLKTSLECIAEAAGNGRRRSSEGGDRDREKDPRPIHCLVWCGQVLKATRTCLKREWKDAKNTRLLIARLQIGLEILLLLAQTEPRTGRILLAALLASCPLDDSVLLERLLHLSCHVLKFMLLPMDVYNQHAGYPGLSDALRSAALQLADLARTRLITVCHQPSEGFSSTAFTCRRYLDLVNLLLDLGSAAQKLDPHFGARVFGAAVDCVDGVLALLSTSGLLVTVTDEAQEFESTRFLGSQSALAMDRTNVLYAQWLALKALSIACSFPSPNLPELSTALSRVFHVLDSQTTLFTPSAPSLFADHDGQMLYVSMFQLRVWIGVRDSFWTDSGLGLARWMGDDAETRTRLLSVLHPSNTFANLLRTTYDADPAECLELVVDGSVPFVEAVKLLVEASVWTVPRSTAGSPQPVSKDVAAQCLAVLDHDIQQLMVSLGKSLARLDSKRLPGPALQLKEIITHQLIF